MAGKKSYLYPILLLLILLLLGIIPLSATAQEPEPSSAPQLGFHVGQGDSTHMAAVRAAGGRFVVVVFNWANIEPEPNYVYWEIPDAALRAAEFHGVEVIARLDQPPDWALDPESPTPWNLEAYTGFARRVAERYGNRLAGLTVWNEPNLDVEWNDQPPDAAAYAEMLKATYPVIKSVNPDLPVLIAGLTPTEGEGDWAINDLDYLQALYAAGIKDSFDIFTAHPYGFGRSPGDAPEKYRPNFRRLELYREIMAANDDSDKPIWVTEMGWLTWTNDPKSDWQLITPEIQAGYILGAIDYAREHYPWLERLAVWQLNSAGDPYGFGIWHGPDQSSPAYEALVATCQSRSALCAIDPAYAASEIQNPETEIPILAPDVIIRLGDRGTLHPHWVHLYRAKNQASLTWQGEFFLKVGQTDQAYELLLETMQVDQSTNQLLINDVEIAYLRARPQPDPTSTWVTQRFGIPPDILKPGLNRLMIKAGLRSPTRQYTAGRWENMQFRHIRLSAASPGPQPLLTGWQFQPSPSGWSETNRLRPGLAGDLWLTGIRPGEVWQIRPSLTLENKAGNHPDLIFNDILPTPQGELAATYQGLFWRAAGQSRWEPAPGAPNDKAYVVAQTNSQFYAGFEESGLWQTASPSGPWERAPLTATTVVDITIDSNHLNRSTSNETVYTITSAGIFVNRTLEPNWQSLPLPALSDEAMAEAGESQGDKFRPRLFFDSDNNLVVRNQDRLWLRDPQNQAGWRLFGPEKLYGKLYTTLRCCGPGAWIGSNDAGLWQLGETGQWRRLDNGYFNTTDITALTQLDGVYYAAGDLGLFHSRDGQIWQKAAGLPATITALVVDPANPSRWLAGTPAGVYRSQNSGQSWESVSPPWIIWDIAVGPQGRIFVGRSNGLVWTDDLGTTPIQWQTSDGMERVYFLRIQPHPTDPALVWAGTWGNNVGASNDGGHSFAPLHNGLETLSGLDLIWHPTPSQVTLATFAGLFRTDDGGQSWFSLPGPLSQQTVYALLQTEDGTIWAGAADGLWLSRDYGTTWELANGLPRTTVLRLGRINLSPVNKTAAAPVEWLWAGTETEGIWVSQDGGLTWQLAGLAGRTVYTLFIDLLQPGRLIAATDQGIFAKIIP